MHFMNGALLSENQAPLVIQSVAYGPPWLSGDSDHIPVTTTVIYLAMRAGR
ncbi:hypothetical protein [Polaromonas sp. UC242_47]|uniref:hypothetical protein n=1 Tax=Polaromonas sp. UC242_47 TaxID=3374626 RepID=UPI00379F3A22